MDKLWGMEVFVRVIECGSFTKAAESLNLANATITSSLRNLEKHLGVSLIQRNTRHLHLTQEGALFLPKCREILRLMEDAEASIKASANEVSGSLRIETPVAIGQNLICPALSTFTQRNPQISVSLTLTNYPHKLIEHATDIAIRMDQVEEADLVARPIYEAKYIVCGAPSLVDAIDDESPKTLNPKICLGLFEEGSHTANRWSFNRNDEHLSISPQGVLNFNNTQALIQAALQGTGLIYVLDVFVTEYINNGQLVELYPDWETSVRTFHAVSVKSRYPAPKIRAFIDFLLEIFDARRRPSIARQVEVGPGRRTKKSR